MFCSKCGAEQQEDANFCYKCGFELELENPSDKNNDDNITSLNSKAGTSDSVKIVISTFFSVLLAVGTFYYLSINNETTKRVPNPHYNPDQVGGGLFSNPRTMEITEYAFDKPVILLISVAVFFVSLFISLYIVRGIAKK